MLQILKRRDLRQDPLRPALILSCGKALVFRRVLWNRVQCGLSDVGLAIKALDDDLQTPTMWGLRRFVKELPVVEH